MLEKQKTIDQTVEVSGVGLFTGETSKIKLMPAPEDTGIVFVRNEKKVRANFKNYKDTKFHCTCIEENGQEIITIEHIMAALHCLDISNLYIKLETSDELPILDGSSEKFLLAIKSGIVKKQEKQRKVFSIDKNYEIFYKDTYIKARPSDRLRIKYTFVNNEIFKEPNICEFD
jgi:UDP-3-O-[3-hydroxymyristoyl] N-acetylglucosamine deacetylase